jgi:predicted regulator of Ras-like GTPase activity (Roadblock/LC7/MglB family)
LDKVLADLNERPGVAGSLLATADGMVIASRLRPEWDRDAAAAIVSSVLMAARRAFRRLADRPLSRFVLTSTRLKLVVQDVGDLYLVVATDRHLDLERGLLDVEAAAATLRKLGRLSI